MIRPKSINQQYGTGNRHRILSATEQYLLPCCQANLLNKFEIDMLLLLLREINCWTNVCKMKVKLHCAETCQVKLFHVTKIMDCSYSCEAHDDSLLWHVTAVGGRLHGCQVLNAMWVHMSMQDWQILLVVRSPCLEKRAAVGQSHRLNNEAPATIPMWLCRALLGIAYTVLATGPILFLLAWYVLIALFPFPSRLLTSSKTGTHRFQNWRDG